MTGLYQKALEVLPLQLTVVDDGLTALARLLHEPFDFVIVGRELKEFNGMALMVAVRAAEARNQNIPAILVSSKRGSIPDQARFSAPLFTRPETRRKPGRHSAGDVAGVKSLAVPLPNRAWDLLHYGT